MLARTAVSLRRQLHHLIAGSLWSLLAYLLGARPFGGAIWGGVVAGPIVGMAVGAMLQGPFERTSGARRGAVALLSLYVAGTLFGLGVGIADWQRRGGGRSVDALGEIMVQGVVGIWWGMTVSSFVLFLWPLAYGTHWLLEWLDR